MKILVTGGAGFIGSHLVDQLLEEGHSVWVIDNLSSGQEKYVPKNARFVKADIQDEICGELIKAEKFEAIFHLAAQISLRDSLLNPVRDAEINILGSLNILQAAVLAKTKKIIFSSTGGALYGEQKNYPIPEIDKIEPYSPYAIGKLCVEKYLDFYKKVHGLNYVTLRYANVYGPRQNPFGEAGVVSIFCERCSKGESIFINGDGKQTRDYVYVKDVVKANIMALEMKGSGTFNVGTGVETDVNTLYKEISQLFGIRKKPEHKKAVKGEMLRSALDSSLIKKKLNWEPEVDIKEGIEKTVSFFKENEL